MKYSTLGIIGRFKPLHFGHASVLDGMLEQSERIVVGIGSANKLNAANPFTPDETASMIRQYLGRHASRAQIVGIDDFGDIAEYSDGTRWVQEVERLFPHIDGLVTGNDWVAQLLSGKYQILSVEDFLRTPFAAHGTTIRTAMIESKPWQHLVPPAVVAYIQNNDLEERCRALSRS